MKTKKWLELLGLCVIFTKHVVGIEAIREGNKHVLPGILVLNLQNLLQQQ